MRRRSFLLTILILLVALAAVGGGLYVSARQVPDFYTAALQAGQAPADSGQLLTRATELVEDVRTGRSRWGATFTADELNILLRDQLETGGLLEGVLPPTVAAPRVAIQDDRLLIGMRIQPAPDELASEATSVVISLEVRPWVVKPQPNVIALEVCGAWAGRLPVTSQRYLDQFAEAMRSANIDVTWYRSNGNPVALLKLYADQPRPPTIVRTLTVANGAITLGGQSASGVPGP